MSDWRAHVGSSEWRYRKWTMTSGDVRYFLEAKTVVGGSEWERFGEIDMDCAAEGTGESIAREIVESHNHQLVLEARQAALLEQNMGQEST